MYTTLYTAEKLPVLQNRLFPSEEEAINCPKGDIELVQDSQTGFIFNRAFNPDLLEYDSEYQNEQAESGIFREHLKDVLEIIKLNFQGCSLIEVGCGKGYFLELALASGFEIIGFDTVYTATNPRIRKSYFSKQSGIKGEGIVLRHVLEHVQNPVKFLVGILAANGGHGKIYIEVPNLDWILEQSAWFDIFYEHVNYFRLSDFERMFGTVYESGLLFGEQYLYVIADLESIKVPSIESGVGITWPTGFLHSVNHNAIRLSESKAKPSVVWGGASKGVIFSLFMQRAGAQIDHILDINPEKLGRYLPGTGLLVESPEHVCPHLPICSDVFVMNSNYLSEIRNSTCDRFNYILVEND